MEKKIISSVIAMLFITLNMVMSQDKDSVVSLPEIRITSMASINEKVANSFTKKFPDATDLKWFKYDQGYLAKFIQKDMDHNALFRKSGFLVYDIGYGYEKHIPVDIYKLVTDLYDNYKVIRSINIKTGGRDIWVVKLEGLKKYATVRIEDMELDEVERFDKADID